MSLTGIKFCKPTVVDTKKQNSGPIFQPLRLLSSASNTMHQTKHHDFPFVPLTGHKLVDDPSIPTSFDIMDDHHTDFDEDFGFVKGNNFTNARAIFKNASFKGCHQFPMISISQLVGGFVGSKSQVRAKNRESHQIWDIVFQKLDEFVNSRPVERYSEHCYEFQTLSQNLIGSLYKEGSSPLGLAASYILADGARSFKNSKPTSNITKSSPTTQNPVEIIPPPVDTFVSHIPVPASHSPSNQSAEPVILNIVEHLISQSDLSNCDSLLLDPVRFACVNRTVPTSSALKPSAEFKSLSERTLNEDPNLEETTAVATETKISYAEVAKMGHGRLTTDVDRRQTRCRPKTSSRRSRKVGERCFVRNDSRQRRVEPSNWRDQSGSSQCRDLRRHNFNAAHSGAGKTLHCWKNEQKSESLPKEASPNRQRRGNDSSKRTRPRVALKTVPEFCPRSTGVDESKPVAPENPCRFYNPNKRSCANWRCRQHCERSSAKRNMRFVLSVDTVGDDDEETENNRLSQSPDGKNGDIRVNTFESYITVGPRITTLPSGRTMRVDSDVGIGERPSAKQSLPSVPPTKGDGPDVPTRERSLSEGSECRGKSERTPKERSSSESSESVGRSRSISEESKGDSPSLSSVSSSSRVSEVDHLRRRFSSECDSEDSFVIFDGGESDSESAGDSDWGDWESDSDDSDCPRVSLALCVTGRACDEVDSAALVRLREVNVMWGGPTPTPSPTDTGPCKKVRFACGRGLATVHPMVAWSHAYRASRCGPWEVMARDRERFRQRVERSEAVLAAVLCPKHRDAVLARIAAVGRHDIAPR